MATKYNIAVDLSANPTALISGFAAAEAAVDKFQRSVDRSMNSVNSATNGMKASMSGMATSVGDLDGAMSRTAKSADDAGQSMNKASSYTRAFNGSVAPVVTSANNLADGMDKASSSAKNVGAAMDGTASGTSKASTGLNNTGKAASLAARDLDRFNRVGRGVSMTAMGIGAAVVGGIGASLYVFTQYESALAGVAKTTDASATQMRKFDLAFREMSRAMPAGYEEISNVAEAAAQLGVKNKDITKFTDTMIRMGTSTNLASEDAANALARMMNIMGTAGSDVDRFGSTIVKMGNVSAATEQDIVNMGMRIAGMGKSLDMSEADVVALATSLSDLGVRAEMGGSAISTIMSKTASAIEQGTDKGQKWAEVMGMSIGKVQKLFKEDAYGGLIKMVEGLEKVKASGGNLDKTLRDLGINEMRQLDVMKRLVGASDDLTSAQQTANAEWKTNTALINESTKRYETFGSQVKMIWNGIQNIAANIGGAFAKADGGSLAWIKSMVDGLEQLTNKFFDAEGEISRFGQSFVDAATKIAGITAVLAAAGAAFMMFGTGGVYVVAAVAGIGLVIATLKKLGDAFNSFTDTSNFGRAMREIDTGLSGVTEGKAEKFIEMRDSINKAMTDIHLQSTATAKKTKADVLAEVSALTDEIVAEVNKKADAMEGLTKRLMESATGQEKAALKGVLNETKRIRQEQINLVKDAQSNINKVLSNAYDERRTLNNREYSDLNVMFASMDKVYKTHVSKNVSELQQLGRAFSELSKDSSLKDVQNSLTDLARGTIKTMDSMTDSYNKQREAVKSFGYDKEEEKVLLAGLRQEYDKNRLGMLNNLQAYENEAKSINKKADVLKDLTAEEKRAIGIKDELTDSMAAYGSIQDIANEQDEIRKNKIKSVSDAIETQNSKLNESSDKMRQVAQDYTAAGKNVKTLGDAFEKIKEGAPKTAEAIGKGFISSFENGVGMVDLGTKGKMKVDEFIAGIRSGEISVGQAAIAQVNAFRSKLGLESLTPAGEKKINEFITGFKKQNLTEIATKLGLDLKSGMKVDLGSEGKVSVESFVNGLKTGEYSAVEMMTFFQTTLKNASKIDLATEGSDTMKTLKLGLETGMLSAEQVFTSLKDQIKPNAVINLEGEGRQTLESLVAGLNSGKLSVGQFLTGLQQLTRESAKMDLMMEGNGAIASFVNGMVGAMPGLATAAGLAKQTVETSVSGIDNTIHGQGAMSTLAGGIMSYMGLVTGNARMAKQGVETTLGSITDGSGGMKAMAQLSGGLAANAFNPIGQALLISNNVESELSNTTDGGGGSKAGNSFLTGFIPFIGKNTAQASEMKAGVENRLGSTHDGGGGAKAGAKMAADLAAKTGATNTAASSHKQTAEKTMGSTTDGGGGSKAGTKFAGDLQNKTGASRNAASSNKNAVEGVLKTANDGGGGNKAGTEFVRGVQNQSGNARNAGSNVASSGKSGLGSGGSTFGLGQDLAWGFIRGIGSLVNEAARVAGGLASAAMGAIKRMQRSNSPSKETMKLGGDFGDGYVIGVVDKAKAAAKSAKTVVGAALDAANKANVGFDMNDIVSPINSGTINKRLSAETSQFASVELSGKQPAHINVNVGGQDFYAFSDNIYSASRKKLNFKDRYDL